MVNVVDKVLATGIGSLPHTDVEEAIAAIARHTPHVPYWPQLPNKNPNELMLTAFLNPWVQEKLVTREKGQGVFLKKGRTLYREALKKYPLLPEELFPGLFGLLEAVTKGLMPQAVAIKGQITGPHTLCKYNITTTGKPLHYDVELATAILELVDSQLHTQIKLLRSLKLPVIICIDEPAGLLSWEEPNYKLIEAGLINIIERHKAYDCSIAIHVCSEPNWEALVKYPWDIISFDSYLYGSNALENPHVEMFLETKGKIAWGIVPTSDVRWPLVLERLEPLKGQIIKKGGLLTPSCGLALATEEVAREIMDMVYKIEKSLSK